MIYRLANHCFWLQAYFQRVKESATYLKIYHKYYLDHEIKFDSAQDHPLIVAAGFVPSPFEDGVRGYREVFEMLIWDETFENSIFVNFKNARSNAHFLREVICDESWATINDLWLWIQSEDSRKLYDKHPGAFFDRIIEHHQLTQGIFQDTLSQDEFYHFMRLGVLIEKITYHTKLVQFTLNFSSENKTIDAIDLDRMLLEAIYGWGAFCRAYAQAISPETIEQFVLTDPNFPGSITLCIRELCRSLRFIGFSNKNSILDVEDLLSTLDKNLRQKSKPNHILLLLQTLINKMDELVAQLSTEYFQEKSI